MNKIVWCAACASFFATALCSSAASRAQSPFDGTWRIELAQTKFSPKPLTFYIGQGWYHCLVCNPTFAVQADGQDHPVTGQAYDAISVTVVDPHTISLNMKKGGKLIGEQTRTVSADGKILTVKGSEHSLSNDQTATYEGMAKRSGIAPSGVHATSGAWILEKESGSANGLTITYKLNGDELTMTEPTGETYTAKLDGGDFPAKGAVGYDTVSLKRINANTVEETDKRGGKDVDVAKMTVNGKTMTIVDTDPETDRTSTYVAHKQ